MQTYYDSNRSVCGVCYDRTMEKFACEKCDAWMGAISEIAIVLSSSFVHLWSFSKWVFTRIKIFTQNDSF